MRCPRRWPPRTSPRACSRPAPAAAAAAPPRPADRPHARPLALPRTGSVVAGTALLADGDTARVEFSLGSSGAGEALLYTAIVRDVRERFEAERRIREIADG